MNHLTVSATEDQLETVLAFIEGELMASNCPAKASRRLSLAAEEVFINIAHYAYAPQEGSVDISMSVSGDPLVATLVFSDSGTPYNPLEKSDPDVTLGAGDRDIGGLGIYMVKKNVDEVRYLYGDGHNVLTLIKTLV